MRQSGDHIIFGEIRASQQTRDGTAGSPAFPFVMALNSGHRASMTTIHANGGRESLEKFVNYCFFSGPTVPERVFRAAVAEAFGVVVQLKKEPGTHRKGVHAIHRVAGLDASGAFILVTFNEKALLDLIGHLNPGFGRTNGWFHRR
ncbi:MAG: ATPase, T2SS/T4P/T4SS family [Acidobacteriota bacterium]|nr:ATPase, T2SS/T4P/T4SS family [Acidobacteriota bacterium]